MKRDDNLKRKITITTIGIILVILLSGCSNLTGMNNTDDNQVGAIIEDNNINKCIEDKFEAIGYDKTKIKKIMNDKPWANGPRYKVLYEDAFLYVYSYDNGEIASIRDEQLNFIYENKDATGVDENNIEEGSIELIEGQLGEYGKEDIYDSEKYIRYYVPAGTYTAKALTRNSEFFIEKIKITKNSSGYDESETVRKVSLGDVGSEETIEINEDECISLVIKSSITLKKK